MEYLDVLDENGNLTGKKKLRTEIHRDGDWHKAAHVWIVNSKNQILLQKRSATKDSHPGDWDISAAGHITAGFTSKPAAIKEINEELGLVINENELEFLFSYNSSTIQNNNTFFNNSFYDEYLLVKDLDIDNLKLQEEEVSEVKWVSLEELEYAVNSNDPNFVPHPSSYPKLFKILRKKFK